MVYIVNRFYLLFQGTKKAVTMKTGPNNALRHIIWAISTRFFIYFRVHAYWLFLTIISGHEVG